MQHHVQRAWGRSQILLRKSYVFLIPEHVEQLELSGTRRLESLHQGWWNKALLHDRLLEFRVNRRRGIPEWIILQDGDRERWHGSGRSTMGTSGHTGA